jgi:hypothetical protein
MEYVSMAFNNLVFVESCFLKLVINIARKYKVITCLLIISSHLLSHLKQQIKACMRHSIFIRIIPMAREEPEFLRIILKELRISSLLKSHLSFSEVRICFPQSYIASEVRQSRVNAHASSSCDKQSFALL